MTRNKSTHGTFPPSLRPMMMIKRNVIGILGNGGNNGNDGNGYGNDDDKDRGAIIVAILRE